MNNGLDQVTIPGRNVDAHNDASYLFFLFCKAKFAIAAASKGHRAWPTPELALRRLPKNGKSGGFSSEVLLLKNDGCWSQNTFTTPTDPAILGNFAELSTFVAATPSHIDILLEDSAWQNYCYGESSSVQ
jgi:hypothetical protein